MLNINVSSSRRKKRLVKMKLNFATENFYSFYCIFFLRMPLNHPRGRSLDSWFILQQKLRSIKIEASCWVLKFHYHTSPYYRYLFSIHMRPLGREDLPWYLYSEYSVTCLPRFHLFLGENFPFLCAVEYVSKLPKRSGISLLNSDDHLFAS